MFFFEAPFKHHLLTESKKISSWSRNLKPSAAPSLSLTVSPRVPHGFPSCNSRKTKSHTLMESFFCLGSDGWLHPTFRGNGSTLVPDTWWCLVFGHTAAIYTLIMLPIPQCQPPHVFQHFSTIDWLWCQCIPTYILSHIHRAPETWVLHQQTVFENINYITSQHF